MLDSGDDGGLDALAGVAMRAVLSRAEKTRERTIGSRRMEIPFEEEMVLRS